MNINNDGTASRGRFFYAVHRDDKQAGKKKMPEKDPSNWPGVVWLIAIGSAMAGGVMSMYLKWLGKKASTVHLIFEWVIGSLLGFFVFMLTVSLDYPEGICGFAAAMAGSMSTSLLTLIHAKIKGKIEKI